MKPIIAIFFASIFVFACSPSGDSAQTEALKTQMDSLGKEVMRLHDVVMPQTLELENLKKKINAKIDSIEIDSISKEEVLLTINKMDSAIIGMRDWMSNYEVPSDTMSIQSVIEFYIEEIKKMQKVEGQTNTALPEAKESLSKLDTL